MLWILLIVSILLIISGLNSRSCEDLLVGIGIILGAVTILTLSICLYQYNYTKSTADQQIKVLELRNEEVISQIEPLVKQYLEYESNTLRDLKPTADKIIAISSYPELKSNEFIQTQIKIILDNQNRITDLKLNKVVLNSYKLWLFMGE